MANLLGPEKSFYIDQQTIRECRLSEEIDEEFENHQQALYEVVVENEQQLRKEQDFIMSLDSNYENTSNNSMVLNSSMNESSLDVSVNRSGYARIIKTGIEMGVQTDLPVSDKPKLRINKRVATDDIKSTCARISSTCGISVEMSRKVVQIVCHDLYKHDFYLSLAEQASVEGNSNNYIYVLPSSRTINDHKQILSSETEREAAIALNAKKPNIKATVHFDTTSRSSIDGDWPSIILSLSSGFEYRLRPLFFAFEDREQITDLFVETFHRLALTLNSTAEKEVLPSTLWENVDALMTDAVTKNLGIAQTISKTLQSSHHPLHLLCKSHTVEAIDRSSLQVLSTIEKRVNQQQIFESINPALRSFFRGKKALVEAGIEALLTLITHDKSGKSCSQADLFDHICEREGVNKRVFLYQQRRFAKLGKAASSVFQAKDILQMLVDEVSGTNQLVESCKIYLSSELFITELECLAYFNHYVTFPFLNCIENSTQSDLLNLLPALHTELKATKITTLQKFIVSIHGIPNPTLTSEISQTIVNEMCISAAAAIKLQCAREYGFSDEDEKLRTTDLSVLTNEELEGLPTNNLITERDLSRFDREARVSKCRNRRFKAKNIRNNMVLYKNKSEYKIDKTSRKICTILLERETKWNDKQKSKLKERLEMKLQKAVNSKDYTRRLLQNCKSWGGPCISVEELQQSLKSKPDQEVTIVRTELSYYVHTHKANKISRPDLYRLNGIPHEERLLNLSVLLEGENLASSCTVADLPTNEDVDKALKGETAKPTNHANLLTVNELCIVVWQNCDRKYEWYIAYIKEITNDGCVVDHLHRVAEGCNNKWKYPSTEDIQTAEAEQIISCSIEGNWDITPDTRKRHFSLQNQKLVEKKFACHVK